MCRTFRSIALPPEMDEWQCRNPQVGCACTPIHTEVHQVQFLHLMWCFLMYSWRILHRTTLLTIKVTHTPESQFTSKKACSAVTRLSSCSVDTLTSLIFLNEEELSCKPAEQQGLGGQADTVCTWCWGALWEPNTRACDPPRPRLAQGSVPPSPMTYQTPQN